MCCRGIFHAAPYRATLLRPSHAFYPCRPVPGDFALPITRVATYATPPAIKAPEPRVVLLTSTRGTTPMWKGLEEYVRSCGVPYAAVRVAALEGSASGGAGAAAAAQPLAVTQDGDDFGGAVGAGDAAELVCALLGQPAAAGTTFSLSRGKAGRPAIDAGALLAGANLKPDA